MVVTPGKGRTLRGTNAERLALVDPGIHEGAIFFETDTEEVFWYDGSTWHDIADAVAGTYLKLDASNDPLTDALEVQGRVTMVGLDGGYRYSDNPMKLAARMMGMLIPRTADLVNFVWMDHLDDAAWWHKRITSYSITPPPTGYYGTPDYGGVFKDNIDYIVWSAGAGVYPIVFEVKTNLAGAIPAGNNSYVNVGLTFRNSQVADNPTGVKIEAWNTGTSAWDTMVDESPVTLGYAADTPSAYCWWISERFLMPGSLYLYGLKITLTGPDPTISNVRLQRVIVYHATANWDTFHLSVGGGTVYGAVTVGGDANAHQLTVKPNAAQTATYHALRVLDAAAALQTYVNYQGGLVVNETGAAVDTRIETDRDQYALFVQGATDRVGIGVASPEAKLDVRGGTIKANGVDLQNVTAERQRTGGMTMTVSARAPVNPQIGDFWLDIS